MNKQTTLYELSRQLLLSTGGFIAMTASATSHAGDITVNVNNVDPSRPGVIMVMLYGKDGFPKDHSKALLIQRKAADSQSLEFTFAISLEEFAIKVLHDEDESGTVSKNWTGIVPSEGLGFSKGARLRLTGPPTFRRAKLRLSEVESALNVTMIYR